MDFSDVDRAAPTAAIKRLEEPGLAGKMTTLAVRPAEFMARALPRPAASMVAKAAEAALTRALDIALFSLRDHRLIAGRVVHSALASASGAVASPRCPSSCRYQPRSCCARSPKSPAKKGKTLLILAPGSPVSKSSRWGSTGLAAPDGAEGGYFALRVLLARGLALAADTLVHKGTAHSSFALMHRALAPIVARFTAVVSQKLAFQGVAVIGAIGGAVVNLAFIEQYYGLARGHFTVRRLERVYGAEAVRAEYGQLMAADLRQPVMDR